jgi:cysteine desulfurase
MKGKILYLDNAATTAVDKGVAKKVLEFSVEGYGNASSPHQVGIKAREELEKARKKIARFIGAKPEEIIFTSGGTESNNLAIKGLAKANPDKKHIITSAIEHPSVLETCKELEKKGHKVDYIPVDENGIVDIEDIKKKISDKTLLVSVMHVNNEIGTIQPLREIGELCKKKGVHFHTDAVQSFGKLNIDVNKMNIDLLSVSGHKVNAPKGIGFLYVRKGTKIKQIVHGGGQEMGLRSGTENVPGIIGLVSALDIKRNKKEIEKIRDHMIRELTKIQGARLNGSKTERIYNNINISFYGIEGESLLLMLDKEGIVVSTGSACSSKKLKESHVLKAIKVPDLYINGSLRLTLGKIAKEEADYVIDKIIEKVKKLQEISPFKLKKEKNV